MKRMIAIIACLLVFVCARTQGTELTFQWHGQTMGVDFEDTNLTVSAKSAIKDDIAYALSLIASSNVTFSLLTPDSSYYGEYKGFVNFGADTRINYSEGVLCYYKEIDGNIRWQIGSQVSSNYLAAITLTNQYASAVSVLSNYLHQFTAGIDISGMTLSEKKALLWNPPLLRLLEETSGDEFEELVGGAVPAVPAPPGACPFPSILAFKAETDLPAEWEPPLFCCNIKVWRGASGGGTFLFCYVNGTWRYSPAGP